MPQLQRRFPKVRLVVEGSSLSQLLLKKVLTVLGWRLGKGMVKTEKGMKPIQEISTGLHVMSPNCCY